MDQTVDDLRREVAELREAIYVIALLEWSAWDAFCADAGNFQRVSPETVAKIERLHAALDLHRDAGTGDRRAAGTPIPQVG